MARTPRVGIVTSGNHATFGFCYNSLDPVKVILRKLQYHPRWLQTPTIELRVFAFVLVSMLSLLYLND